MLKYSVFLAGLWLASAAAPALSAGVSQTNLTSDGTVAGTITDTHLVNAWGMSYAPTGPWWISDNGTGLTTLYDGSGVAKSLVVTIPPAAGATGPSAPTGQVFNPTTAFTISASGKTATSLFLFATEDGTLSGWAPGVNVTSAVTTVDNSKVGKGAVYKGLALAMSNQSPYLLAANFRSGYIEVYDGAWKHTANLRDTTLPQKYSPFNVAVLGGNIYVAYAVVQPDRHDDLPGLGNGVLEQIDITGKVIAKFKVGKMLNSPWGMALAPSTWGRYAGKLLVGNFGDGRITAFDLPTHAQIGQLKTPKGQALVIPGLWGLMPGNGASAGPTTSVYFTAGPNDEANGLFGALTYTP